MGKALELKLIIPATNDDNDDRWSTATVVVRATREMATQTEMEEVHLYPEFQFHLLDLLSGQQKTRWAIEHLIRRQEVIIGDQQSQ